jgi:hypothetical protein
VGSPARWDVSVATDDAPPTLLPPTIPYVASASAEDGRWFVQAYGEFHPLAQARVMRPAMAWLGRADAPGVRLHLLGDLPLTAITAVSPDPSAAKARAADESGRSALLLRRRSKDGSTLKSTFVTVFEPTGSMRPLKVVARVTSEQGTVVLYLETADGPEHLVVNLTPGTLRSVVLVDGRRVRTDGLAVRLANRGLVLAGGTVAETADQRVEQRAASGRIRSVVRVISDSSRGRFETDAPLDGPGALAGRTVFVHHGDETTHGWTIARVENTEDGARIYVREEPGFALENKRTAPARFYQFPDISAPGPHRFFVSKIARSR